MNNENGSDFPRHIYDVLIVGAGPVGLATAIGLRKRGVTNILVIDQTREFLRVGQGVDLLPNGLKAIKYTAPEAYEKIKETSEAYEKIKEAAPKTFQTTGDKNSSGSPGEVKEKQTPPPKKLWRLRNLQGEVIRSFPMDFQSWFDRYGEGRISLSWFDLQTTLRSLLPTETVKANLCCVHYEEEPAWVKIDSIANKAISTNPFAHWEMMQSNIDPAASTQENLEAKQESFYAKLVIAADGINSTVRQLLYKNKGIQNGAKPLYSGFGVMGCLQVENVPSPIIEELENNYFHGERIVSINNNNAEFNSSDLEQTRVILFRRSETTLGYVVNAPYSLEHLLNGSPSEILDLGIEALKNAQFLPIFSELVRLSPADRLFHRPYYLHPTNTSSNPQPAWSHGRVVLVGDAAHGMPPFIGQGSNQGLEDAAVIATFLAKMIQGNGLDQENEVTAIFEKYEQIRKPFMNKIEVATKKNFSWNQQEWDDFNEIIYRREYPSSETLGGLG